MIGENLKYSLEEQEEDVLELLYSRWKNRQPLNMSEVAQLKGLEKNELYAIIRRMIKNGYLRDSKDRKQVILTDFGKAQGEECLERHFRLTEFIEMISGVDRAEAEENACRLEHIISEGVLQGFLEFMKDGMPYDRELHDTDLGFLYAPGTYPFTMGLYHADKRYPRVLAPEAEVFGDAVTLEIGEAGSFFLLKPQEPQADKTLWYSTGGRWVKAAWSEEGYRLPAKALVLTINSVFPVKECEGIVAYLGADQMPGEDNCCDLNIHIW
ncbi:MAG: iron dependent repressor, metal binding and dimerization domain protein [Eubacterium sp.]|nr:iron dependent repressor, metal binding and dimerization domain protein [Eubacterium sp.]